MERESLHEIPPSSSSLPDEPDFSIGRSRLVIDSQENNKFPPQSSALCQMHPWCSSAQNNPLAPWMSLLFAPLAWSSSLFLPGGDSGIYFLPYYHVQAIAHHGSKTISYHFWSFQANSSYISSTKLMTFFIYDCGNNSITWVIRGWRYTFATPRAEQCSYHWLQPLFVVITSSALVQGNCIKICHPNSDLFVFLYVLHATYFSLFRA